MNPRQFPWYLLMALLIGLSLGLLYAWVISPVRYVEAAPYTLRADFKDQFRAAIAAAYVATGDLGRAQARLALLGDPDPLPVLTAQAQRTLAEGGSPETVRALVLLAAALQQDTSSAETPISPTPQPAIASPSPVTSSALLTATPTRRPTRTPTPSDTPTPFNSPTPRPTRSPTATVGAPFVLVSKASVCDPNLPEGLLQVLLNNAAGKPVPGAEIVITWNNGEEHFFTGFKPELGDGYADFQMTPGVIYTLRLADGGTSVPDLSAPSCQTESGETYWGGLHLIFQQP